MVAWGVRAEAREIDLTATENNAKRFGSPLRPVGLQDSLLPVMVYIHGGAYLTGSSNAYALDALVARSNGSVVVVTANYRLNALGFLGSHALSARSAGEGSGNFGIMDQRLALQWVKDNIAACGIPSSLSPLFPCQSRARRLQTFARAACLLSPYFLSRLRRRALTASPVCV